MCLYPKRMINKKYTVTDKNGGCIPPLPKNGSGEIDERVLYVDIPCGNCIECRKEKANEWRTRMYEELKITNYPYFITLTFDPLELKKLCNELTLNECNAVATKAVRRFLERFRKQNKKSLKHWLITELGHSESERIHLHGILFSEKPITEEQLQKYWAYGNIWIGEFCNEQTINYIVKYITKLDTDHKGYKGVILCSPGIGKNFLNNSNNKIKYKYEKGETRTYYSLPNGAKTKLPVYYRNHLFNEDEREQLWQDSMDLERTIMLGVGHSLNEPGDVLERVQNRAQETNTQLGYGSDSKEWRKKDYNVTLNMVRKWEREKDKIKAYKAGKDTYIPEAKRKYPWDKRENVL